MDKELFVGKTLLMLGSNSGSVEMVCYAKDRGAHTIVVDNLPIEQSIAKQYSDEHLLISTADINTLIQIIKSKHVDGIISGISEFNLIKARELSEVSDRRFYCSSDQWNKIEHKNEFRELCKNYDVSCPNTYYIGRNINECDLNKLTYPVVVKPVDGAASIGVHICEDKVELKNAFNDAIKCSYIGLVIVEEYVYGNEFTAHYTICNGKASLSCIDNRYPISIHEGKVTTIPIARIYPSIYIDNYIKSVNNSMIRLCESLKLDNGVLFVQGIYNKDMDKFWIFEAGLRSAAELPSRFLEKINGVNYLHNIIDYILLGKGTLDLSKEDPYLHGKCCGIVSFAAKKGVVGEIKGLEEAVKSTPSVIDYECRYSKGCTIPDTDTLRQLMVRFVMVSESREKMAQDVDYLNNHITVLDKEGKNMVIKCDPNRITNEN